MAGMATDLQAQEGAAGFLPKESTRSELVNAVLDCAKGRAVVAPSLAAGLAGEIRKRAEPEGPTLSPREREVLKLIAAGSSIPAMAKELFDPWLVGFTLLATAALLSLSRKFFRHALRKYRSASS